MNTNSLIIFTYGLIVMAGGVIGYMTAGSIPSLIMGITFGLLLLGSGWALTKKSTLAHFSAVTLSTILALFFLYRFGITWKIMPAGMMAAISLLVLGYFFMPRKAQAN